MGKLGELLSDEESVKQLSELAQMLMSETVSDNNNSSNEENEADESTAGGLFSNGFDINSLMKIQGLVGAMNQKDKNADLLAALKPHLKSEKHEKVDKAIKILKLLAIWNIVKESGMLKDIL